MRLFYFCAEPRLPPTRLRNDPYLLLIRKTLALSISISGVRTGGKNRPEFTDRQLGGGVIRQAECCFTESTITGCQRFRLCLRWSLLMPPLPVHVAQVPRATGRPVSESWRKRSPRSSGPQFPGAVWITAIRPLRADRTLQRGSAGIGMAKIAASR